MKTLNQKLLALDRLLLPEDDDFGRWNYLWLAYTAFLFMPLIWGWSGWRFIAPTLVSVVLFLPIYFVALRGQSPQGWWAIAAMLLLCLALASFNPSAFTYAVYAAAFTPVMGGGVRRSLVIIAAIVLITMLVYGWFGLPVAFMAMGAIVTVMVGVSNLATIAWHEKNAELKLSHQEVRRLAGKAERERIARDLHDLLGHTMSVVIRKAELARRLFDENPSRAKQEIAVVEKVGREALELVREAVSGYRAPRLAAEIAAARLTLETSGIEAHFDDAPPLPETAGAVLAMVLREAVTNIIRHSGAHKARVEFARESNRWRMDITDDGKGGQLAEGNGIRGMRERLAAIGGALELSGANGCRLQVTLPAGGVA